MSVETAPVIVGRSSSHFTRLVRIFAIELGVDCRFEPIYDLTSLDADAYAGNPALKMPTLRMGDTVVFGAENICRTLSEIAMPARSVVWPSDLRDPLSRNTQELVWHAMQAQVQLSLGMQVAGLAADNVYFAKAITGLRNVLTWLDEHAPTVIAALPPRDISLLEASLFCLLEHLRFRQTMPLDAYGRLNDFALRFGERGAARLTPYGFDKREG